MMLDSDATHKELAMGRRRAGEWREKTDETRIPPRKKVRPIALPEMVKTNKLRAEKSPHVPCHIFISFKLATLFFVILPIYSSLGC